MFGRYNKVVPPHQKSLIRRHGLPRPNWYVGAAEQPSSLIDPQLRQEIDQIKNDLSGQEGPAIPKPPADPPKGGAGKSVDASSRPTARP
jgi:hypothetical protein